MNKNAHKILTDIALSSYGVIEGRLQAVQDKLGRLQFQIYDSVQQQTVNCSFPDKMISEVFANYRKLVEVTGFVHYRASGSPFSICAVGIDTAPDDDELPSPEDVRGILNGAR